MFKYLITIFMFLSFSSWAEIIIKDDLSKLPTIRLDENNSTKIERPLLKAKKGTEIVKIEMVCTKRKSKFTKYDCKAVQIKSIK